MDGLYIQLSPFSYITVTLIKKKQITLQPLISMT